MVAADNHGCRLDKGQRWCSLLKECVGERVPRRRRDPQFPPKMNLAAKCRYDQCDPGTHDTGACTYEWAGLSWDVSPLRRAAHYVIKDVEDQDEVAYTVGICRDVNPADVHAACEETTGSARESMDEAAPAYQVFDAHGDDAHGAECYRTGGTLGDVGNSKWGLIDPQNPSGGVYVRYYGGNTCSKTSPTRRDACDYEVNGMDYCRRSTKISFVCNNHIAEVSENLDVKEGTGCAYEVTMNSVYGCPLECPRGGEEGYVCSNRGICAYDGLEDGLTVDGEAGVARCLCKWPYGGDDCYEYATLTEVTHYVTGGTSRVNVFIWWVGLLAILVGIAILLKNSQHRIKIVFTGLYNLLGGHDDRNFELATTGKAYQADGDENAAFIFADDRRDQEAFGADAGPSKLVPGQILRGPSG